MFTGIIEGQGALVEIRALARGSRLRIRHPFGPDSVAPGDSVAVDGICLTAVDPTGEDFLADVSPETLKKTRLGSFRVGTRVNLERALTPTSRMGGHFVSGHVDGLGTLIEDRRQGDFYWMRFRVPDGLERYLAPKGSVAIDGVSLTVAEIRGNEFAVAVIPTTRDWTNLGGRKVPSPVHLEMDILAKYVEAQLRGRSPEGISMELLERAGYVG